MLYDIRQLKDFSRLLSSNGWSRMRWWSASLLRWEMYHIHCVRESINTDHHIGLNWNGYFRFHFQDICFVHFAVLKLKSIHSSRSATPIVPLFHFNIYHSVRHILVAPSPPPHYYYYFPFCTQQNGQVLMLIHFQFISAALNHSRSYKILKQAHVKILLWWGGGVALHFVRQKWQSTKDCLSK